MRTKNKIRSRRTAQTKKEIKNKEKQKEKPGSALLGEIEEGFQTWRANAGPLVASAATSADNNNQPAVGTLACRGIRKKKKVDKA